MQGNIRVGMMLAGDDMRSLILQQLHDMMHDLITLRMTSLVDTTLLHGLTLAMRSLGSTPRIRVRSGHLDIFDILDGSMLFSAHRRIGLRSRNGLVGVCLLVVLLCTMGRDVLVVERAVAVANEIHPDLAVSDELARGALTNCDAISDLFAD